MVFYFFRVCTKASWRILAFMNILGPPLFKLRPCQLLSAEGISWDVLKLVVERLLLLLFLWFRSLFHDFNGLLWTLYFLLSFSVCLEIEQLDIYLANWWFSALLFYLPFPILQHCLAQPPVRRGDGPLALVLAPTRELAQQIEKEVPTIFCE